MNKKLKQFLIFAFVVLVALTSGDKGDTHWSHWAYLLFGISLFLAFKIWEFFSLSAALVFAYTVLSSFIIYAFPNKELYVFDPWVVIGMQWTSAYSLISLLIFTAFFLHLKSSYPLMRALGWFVRLDAFYVCFQAAMGASPDNRYGLIGNTSMNASFIAAAFPLCFDWEFLKADKKTMIGIIPIVAAIFLSGASTPVVVFVSVLFAHIWVIRAKLFSDRQRLGRFILGAVTACLALFLIVKTGYKGEFFNSSNRSVMWLHALERWTNTADLAFGTGQGTFLVLGEVVRKSFGLFENGHGWDRWIFMHNDWLQLLFEQGIIGLILYLWLVSDVLYRSRHVPRIFCSAIGFMVCAFFNFPTHLAIPSLTAFVITSIALRIKKDA